IINDDWNIISCSYLLGNFNTINNSMCNLHNLIYFISNNFCSLNFINNCSAINSNNNILSILTYNIYYNGILSYM
ncbi:hypothetical protein Dimus_029114, partial [Dionaea muscipula]